MTDRELMQHMLEVLNRNDYPGWQLNIPIVIALRERLAQPEMQPCAGCKIIMDSLQKQADLATDALDRRWALEMIAAVAARSSK